MKSTYIARRCISYYSYIKPQQYHKPNLPTFVVYRTIPTSNHNRVGSRQYICPLYIVLFLHQTTTDDAQQQGQDGCISYYSYIKPQLDGGLYGAEHGCISYYSYIKPQHMNVRMGFWKVVYRTIPTSNHNS